MTAAITILADPAPAAAVGVAAKDPRAVDIDLILKPFAGATPTGSPLRYAGDYDRIRAARREDDASLPQGVWQSELKRASWDDVEAICLEALASKSKDIQIACWLLEALIHRQGFAGVPTGLSVIVGLCTTFWTALHPAIEDGDLSYRLAPFEWANDKLPPAIYRLPLTQPGIVTPMAYAWETYANAVRLDQIQRANPNAKNAAGVKLGDFDAAAAATSTAFYRNVQRHLERSLALLGDLDAVLDGSCGKVAPSLAGLRAALLNVQSLVQTILRNRGEGPMAAEAMTKAAAEPITPSTEAEAAAPYDGVIHDRDTAYRLILDVAEFLARMEPHSPTPYLLRRAYSWGMMPLHELLGEMTRGRKDLAALFELLGLNHP
jgi:type VI secretion system protein ImpA